MDYRRFPCWQRDPQPHNNEVTPVRLYKIGRPYPRIYNDIIDQCSFVQALF